MTTETTTMPHTIEITLTQREREALDALRAALCFRSDEQTVLAGLYKLSQWTFADVDPTLFRLDRKTALRDESLPVAVDPAQPLLPGTEPIT